MTKIEMERRRAGLTQKQLADLIGVTAGTVSSCFPKTHCWHSEFLGNRNS